MLPLVNMPRDPLHICEEGGDVSAPGFLVSGFPAWDVISLVARSFPACAAGDPPGRPYDGASPGETPRLERARRVVRLQPLIPPTYWVPIDGTSVRKAVIAARRGCGLWHAFVHRGFQTQARRKRVLCREGSRRSRRLLRGLRVLCGDRSPAGSNRGIAAVPSRCKDYGSGHSSP